jgi:hypothetical protein
MAVEFGYKVYVTKGELATIMGLLAYGAAKRILRSGTSPLGAVGLDIIEILAENTGIYLDNPEVVQLLDALAAAAIITPEVRAKVADFTAARLAAPPDLSPEISAPATHRWRLPEGVDPSDWFTQDIWPEALIGDGFLRVWTNAIECLHPAAIKEV